MSNASALTVAAYDREGLQLVFRDRRPTVRVVCRSCGAVHEKSVTHGTPPPDRARRLVIEAGWESRGGRWTCPTCLNSRKKDKPVTLKVVSTEPRQPTVDDRRLIRVRLEEVYDTGRAIYSGDWSDAKVAAELDVPPAWVAGVREIFGEDRCEARPLTREEVAKLFADLRGEAGRIDKVERDLAAAVAEVAAVKARLTPQLERIAKAYDEARR